MPGRRGGAGFEGAGEGRKRVGHWQGGITDSLKFFFKIKNPMGPFIHHCTDSEIRCTLMPTMEQGNPHSLGTVVTGETPLPNWLSCPDPKPPRLPAESKALRHVEYEQIFERVIEDVYRGRSLQSLIEDDHRLVSYEDFLRWVKRDPQRHERFKEAQEMRTEFLAGEILEIADGVDSIDASAPETVNRDKLRIDTRKWLMGAHNRKRYGETKQIEVGGTISITEALQQAQMRVIEAEVLDVTPRLTDEET